MNDLEQSNYIRLVNIALQDERVKLNGKKVKLLKGRYKDRIAEIDGIIFNDGYKSQGFIDLEEPFLYCCMVLRADGKGHLNNLDSASRSYHPLSYFELVEE